MCYLAVDAAVAAQAVWQAGVDTSVAGQAGELVEATGLEGEGRVDAQLLIRVVSTFVHGVAAPPVGDALPIGAVELIHVTAGGLGFPCRHRGHTPTTLPPNQRGLSAGTPPSLLTGDVRQPKALPGQTVVGVEVDPHVVLG